MNLKEHSSHSIYNRTHVSAYSKAEVCVQMCTSGRDNNAAPVNTVISRNGAINTTRVTFDSIFVHIKHFMLSQQHLQLASYNCRCDHVSCLHLFELNLSELM